MPVFFVTRYQKTTGLTCRSSCYLLSSCGFLEPNVLPDGRVEETNPKFFFQIHFIALGLNADLGDSFVLWYHINPRAIAFFGHVRKLTKM
jgi:hypothetical protein